MYVVYKLTNKVNGKVYFGMTKDLRQRLFSHKSRAISSDINAPLQNAIRKYGWESFECDVVAEFADNERDACCQREVAEITRCWEQGVPNYNIHPGGEGGYSMRRASPERYALWKERLRASRQGKKPALGMKHTEETKRICGEYGKLRWDIHGRYSAEDVLKLSSSEAKRVYGISKTHYHRLRKQHLNSDQV
jgi:group I intron endonuclease